MLSELLRQTGTACITNTARISQLRLHQDASAVLPSSLFAFIAEHGSLVVALSASGHIGLVSLEITRTSCDTLMRANCDFSALSHAYILLCLSDVTLHCAALRDKQVELDSNEQNELTKTEGYNMNTPLQRSLHTRTYIRRYGRACMCIQLHTAVSSYMPVHTATHIHTATYVYKHMYMCIYIQYIILYMCVCKNQRGIQHLAQGSSWMTLTSVVCFQHTGRMLNHEFAGD